MGEAIGKYIGTLLARSVVLVLHRQTTTKDPDMSDNDLEFTAQAPGITVRHAQPYDDGVSPRERRAYHEWYRAARSAEIRRRAGAKTQPRRHSIIHYPG